MKNLLSCGIALMMIVAASCSKDDDQVQPVNQSSSSSVSERVTYATHIEPLARTSCNASNCHNGISHSMLSSGRLIASAHDGKLNTILSGSSKSGCGEIDEESRILLQAWVNGGTPINK